MNRGTIIAGFHATLQDDGEIWYQASAGPAEELICDGVRIKGESLLLTLTKGNPRLTGIVIGADAMNIRSKAVPLTEADFEFRLDASGNLRREAIYRPIQTVRFTPNRNVFMERLTVEMACATPGVEIRYTTDGTPPKRDSKLYTGPISITESTEFAACAYRLGKDGKPLAADDFEINGTRFTVPSYGWFYKQSLKPAVKLDEARLATGLACEHLQGAGRNFTARVTGCLPRKHALSGTRWTWRR